MNRRKTPFVLQKYALPLMALFAEAVEWAISQTQIETQPPGHIAIDPRERGGRYAVWIRYGANRKQIKDYLGPEGCEKHLAAMAALEGYKRIKEQARNLRKLGFESVEHDAALVIAELSNAGLFSGGGILIGTRAFGSILNHLGYKATPFLGTQDVDIARIRTIKLATSLPQGGFGELLKQTGLRFSPVMGLERPPGPPTSFKVIGRDLKVDLLVPALTSTIPYTTKRIPELDAHATTLPFLDYLITESWNTVIIGRDHLIPVRCPPPARYCFHKLVVADMRSGLENPKKDKDTAQAGILAAILHEEDPDSLVEAANAMTSTMVKHAKKTLLQLEKLLAGHYPAALDRMQSLLFGSP
jgi:hypothetical protein